MFFKQIPIYIKQKLNTQHQGFEKKKKLVDLIGLFTLAINAYIKYELL